MTDPDGPFSDRRWSIDAGTIGSVKRGRFEATPAELAVAAKLLDLPDCRNLSIDFELKPMAGRAPGNFRLLAQFKASVVQSCIVTLEPVASKIDERLDIELRPESAEADGVVDSGDLLSTAETDTYAEGRIDFGRLAFELLSVSLDPYPRKAGAEFAEDANAGKTEMSPFAALAKLRKS